jgi:dTMP kinase
VTAPTTRFLVLEGADGCGKTTQALRLVGTLEERGTDVLHVRDPGATRLAEAVREIVLDRAHVGMSVVAETYLYLAARAQLAAEVIRPALERGTTIVCERWTLSTEVYQGLAGGIGADVVRRVGALAEEGAVPALVLVLDVRHGDGIGRIDGAPDRIEARDASFHDRVVTGYRELAAGRPDHVLIAAGSQEDVAAAVLEEVLSRGF